MATPPQPPTADITALTYRVAAVEQRVQRIEDVLHTYVPARENELQLKSVNDTTQRIETEVQDIKASLTDLAEKIAGQRESQDKLQIRVLYAVISVIITILSGVLVAYLTHWIH